MGTTLDNFHPGFVYAVQQGLSACPGATIGSGYRTTEEQAALLYKRAQGIAVADPGTSRHEGNHGGAVDISGDIECFAAAVAPFGLHQGVEGEPWHFEFTDEALAQIEAGTYAYGDEAEGLMTQAQPEETMEDFLNRVLYGGPESADIPAAARAAMQPEAQPAAAPIPQRQAFVPEASAGYDSGDGSSMSAADVAKVYAQAGFTGDALVTMVAIARGESGFNAGARGDTSITDGTWGPSIGLSQIRSLNAQAGTGGWRDPTRLADPAFNARAAYAISNGGTNFSPWTVYNEGIYNQYMEEAKAAVMAIGTGSMAGTGPPAASVSPSTESEGLGDLTSDIFDPMEVARDLADELLSANSVRAATEDPMDKVLVDVGDDGKKVD